MKNFLAKIYLILTLDCEASAKLTCDSFDRDLDWSERVATKLHRLICSKSRKLDRHLVRLNGTLSGATEQFPELSEMPLATKERIREIVRNLGPESSSDSS